MLDRAAGTACAHRGGNHFRDLPQSRVSDQVKLPLSQHVAALGPARSAVYIGGQLRYLPSDGGAVAALVQALADHDGGSAR